MKWAHVLQILIIDNQCSFLFLRNCVYENAVAESQLGKSNREMSIQLSSLSISQIPIALYETEEELRVASLKNKHQVYFSRS